MKDNSNEKDVGVFALYQNKLPFSLLMNSASYFAGQHTICLLFKLILKTLDLMVHWLKIMVYISHQNLE